MVGEHLVRFQLLAAMNTLVLICCDYRAASLVGCVFIAEIAGGGMCVSSALEDTESVTFYLTFY